MDFCLESCFFCSESKDLIHMQTNSLIIDSTYIDFSQLIMDLIQIKIDENYICESCKDQLSQFYLMKQRARTLHMKPADIRNQEIVDQVSNFLLSAETDFVVSKYPKMLAIHSDTSIQSFYDQLYSCNCMIEENDEESQTFKVEIEEVPEVREEFEENLIENYEIIEEETTKNPKNRPKKYQKSCLDPKQREWVKKELKDCAVVLETSLGNKTQWCCKKCSLKTFSTESSFRLHLKSHLNEPEDNKKTRQLNASDHSFIEQKLWIQQQLQSQKKSGDDGKEVWWCSECDFEANKRSRFRQHLQKVHTTILMRGPNKHSCHSCHLRFDGENHLAVHKNCHRIFDVISPFVQFPSCESCKMLFCTNEDFQTHIQRHKFEPEALREPIPKFGVVHRNGETFIEEEEVKELLDDGFPTCGHCRVKFPSENECKLHLLLFHATLFTCPFDSREFSGIPTLSFGNHLRQCHPDIFHEIQITCSFCKMTFDTVYEKLAHTKTCKAKMFQCDHCDKSFFRKAELLHHLKVVTGLIVFACHFCGKLCKDQGDLKTHIRIHTNDRPYKCPHCEKAYKTSSARASHVESHMEQSHICNVCQVKFRRRILYQRHMKLLHDEAYRAKCFAENTCSACNKSYLRKTHFKNHLQKCGRIE